MNPLIDQFMERQTVWQEEMKTLRHIILSDELEETMKWGQPCYMSKQRNIVLIHGFKEYCAILFMKGSLLKDKNRVLVQQTKEVQAARQMRFTSVEEILNLESVIQAYIKEAIEVEDKGLKVPKASVKELVYPEEFTNILEGNKDLKKAFEALTPGRKRAYNLYFSGAKQAQTRTSRIEKYIPTILEGKGMND